MENTIDTKSAITLVSRAKSQIKKQTNKKTKNKTKQTNKKKHQKNKNKEKTHKLFFNIVALINYSFFVSNE